MKKIICLVLAMIMSVAMLSGCTGGKNNGNGSSLYNPDLKIGDTGGLKLPLTDNDDEIVWSVSSANNGMNDSFVVKKIREATGVNLKLLVLAPSVAAEKINVLAASNDLPDIVGQSLSAKLADEICLQGGFAAVEDYIDILPNFKRNFVDNEKNKWIFNTYAAPDGKLYCYYGYDGYRDVNTGVTMYRKDIFDKHGIKMWDSPETFYQVLKKLKELYPDSSPYTSKNKESIFRTWSNEWGLEAHTCYYDEQDKICRVTDVQPKYKEMLDFMKKCYNERLIDYEFLTLTDSAWTAKMIQNDKAFIITDWIGRMEQLVQQAAETVPGYDLRFANPIGPNQTLPEAKQIFPGKYVLNNNKAETAFKLLDFVVSPAGRELITMGIEGETYTINENGRTIYKGFEDKVPSINEVEEKWGMFLEGMYLGFDRRSSYFQFTEREQEAQDYVKDKKNIEPADPELVFGDMKDRRNELIHALDKAGKEFATKYILNNGGDKEWNEWVAKAEKLGYKELEKICNDAQKDYDAAL